MTEEQLLWEQPDWLEEARAWTEASLNRFGARITEPITQPHIRPWSTVLRAQTDQGVYFFKATVTMLSHEAALTQALYNWQPDRIQTVLAADSERSWMLMPDESPMLRAIIQSPADLHHWEKILPLFADFQRKMIPRQADLLALGMLDRRMVGLTAAFERLLQDRAALLVGTEEGLSEEQYRQLIGLVPAFAEMCARLAASGIPETLHHDDFHDANVFVPGGRYVFSDWGESCVTHPFFSMLVCLRSICYRFDWPYGSGEHNYQWAPEILRLRDIYLASWTSYGSTADLLEIFKMAWRVAMVNRALTWHRVVSHLPAVYREKHAYTVPAWLGEFLDAMAE